MNANDTDCENGHDSTEARTERALTEYLTVTPNLGRARGADGLVLVTSQSGESYLVDLDGGRCECPDAEYNLSDGEKCKHERRARFATGRDALPSEADELAVDEYLGEHTDATVRRVASDGGVVPAGESEHAERIDADDGEVWDGPHTEYDRYGEPTGHDYVRCRSCGIEVIDGRQTDATHRDDCPHGANGVSE